MTAVLVLALGLVTMLVLSAIPPGVLAAGSGACLIAGVTLAVLGRNGRWDR